MGWARLHLRVEEPHGAVRQRRGERTPSAGEREDVCLFVRVACEAAEDDAALGGLQGHLRRAHAAAQVPLLHARTRARCEQPFC
jgi:hypothetical protein